jgi:predicted signal transduction protein with EAL and GGDEF domain
VRGPDFRHGQLAPTSDTRGRDHSDCAHDGVLLWQLALPPANINLTSEGMKVALACFIFLQISVFSYNASRLRSLMLRERGVLTKAVETVQDLLVHDTLTGLYNRTHLMSLLERERQRAICSQRPFCVAMIDLGSLQTHQRLARPPGRRRRADRVRPAVSRRVARH